jgi:hypothetical protein
MLQKLLECWLLKAVVYLIFAEFSAAYSAGHCQAPSRGVEEAAPILHCIMPKGYSTAIGEYT